MKEILTVGKKNVKNVNKKAHTAGMSKEDIAVYRVMVMILVNVVSVYTMWTVKQSGARQLAFVRNALPVLLWAFAALTLLAFGAILYYSLRSKASPFKVITLEFIFGVALVAFLVCVLYKQMDSTQLILATLIVSVPYYIYYFFGRTFFFYSLYSSAAIILSRCFLVTEFARLGQFGEFLEILSVILGIMVPIAVIVSVIISANRKDGVLMILGHPVKLYGGRRDQIAFGLLSAVLLIEAILSLVLPAAFAYFFFPLAAMFLLFAIIYAIKMI